MHAIMWLQQRERYHAVVSRYLQTCWTAGQTVTDMTSDAGYIHKPSHNRQDATGEGMRGQPLPTRELGLGRTMVAPTSRAQSRYMCF